MSKTIIKYSIKIEKAHFYLNLHFYHWHAWLVSKLILYRAIICLFIRNIWLNVKGLRMCWMSNK